MIDRPDVRTDNYLVSWWQKDGAWHYAIYVDGDPINAMQWQAPVYDTSDEAVEAANGKR